ncbi:TPM domain-containing protein [Leucobacter denitrificans]|uniref:TPM domain-containing protein n=1 Tax=Leucobacter denitrificans TaxID=683042 RepID=A0A7G9S7F9_9MICO|nr:TPM domain-containing protein [Leucobacter denitrificans]QNN63784.1 TPM domain-containing protein [Leucobacter denitrificans]
MEHSQPSNQQHNVRSILAAATKWLATAAIGAAWMLGSSVAASATEPVSLDSGYVTDSAGVLSADDIESANDRLATTYGETGIDLYVVFVDEFTNPSDRIEWTNTTADMNGLGETQYLLAVATEGRQYFISGYTSGPLSDSDLDKIEQEILPTLRDSNWLGAVSSAAAAIESQHSAPGRNAAVAVGIGVGAVGLGGAAWGVTRIARNKRKQASAQADLTELDRTAGAALVAADDAVKSSAQELEFARAQFGDGAVEDFIAALENARSELLRAFALRQLLDDSAPDTREQKVEWLEEIIELCDAVDTTLDAQVDEFDALRAIEQNAPAVLQKLTQRRQQVEGMVPQVEAEVARLNATYASSALASFSGSTEQLAKLIAFATERETEAQSVLDTRGDAPAAHPAAVPTTPDATATPGGSVAITIREGEAAIGQAEELARTITEHGERLAEVEKRCAELITELERDVATARTLGDPDGSVAGAIAATEQQIAQARVQLSGTGRDPDRALQELDAANTHIDSVVEAAQQAVRNQQLLDAQLAQAGDQVRQAEAYIDARRGAVGVTARTRVAEARASLSRAIALQGGNTPGALVEVRRASKLASEALSSAQSDVSGFGGGYSGGYGGGSYSSGDATLGAILGAILGSGGSGGRSSGRGGGFGGYSGGFGGGSRSGGRSRSGGFGGSSRSSGRRSGGGGGRRSRGGGRF